jgi:hypothetical protein
MQSRLRVVGIRYGIHLDATVAGYGRILHAQGKTFFNERAEAVAMNGIVHDSIVSLKQEVSGLAPLRQAVEATLTTLKFLISEKVHRI